MKKEKEKENHHQNFVLTWFLSNFSISNSKLFIFEVCKRICLPKKWECHFLKKKIVIFSEIYIKNGYLTHLHCKSK